ncbi:LOW QUALITY PROTEIN: hypothetical protein DAPPUDRAFT_234799 [Daphnia pulex]|uniref:Uncharacterized protein n=1 Tax=Daphnia pulex TaxID=6669 RepID=E9FXG2_DAPPU|nr:LOW QUALITY PROTEIN: hypothetical protein DAPPUDRAFT_234799 [Daphnia pulex]|eukprot:EFX88274.1 LOW QUALITY PROTEIN: hypothetical protein DAPPUDRAFT_234799 [Daphnia pulex]
MCLREEFLDHKKQSATHPQQRQPAEGKASLHVLDARRSIPISDVNLQKDRPVCMSFLRVRRSRVEYYTEASNYYTTTNHRREKAIDISRMAPPHYTTKAPEYCTTIYHGLVEIKGERNKQSCDVRVASKYFTTKAPECYTTTDVAPNQSYTEAPNYCTTKALEYYTTTISRVVIYDMATTAAAFFVVPPVLQLWLYVYSIFLNAINYYVVLLLGVVSLMAESTTGLLMSPGYGGYQSTTPPSYYATTTYDTTSYYTEAPKYYTTKEPDYYTTTNAAPAYYTEAPKYYSAPSYYTEVPAYYTTKTSTQFLYGIVWSWHGDSCANAVNMLLQSTENVEKMDTKTSPLIVGCHAFVLP